MTGRHKLALGLFMGNLIPAIRGWSRDAVFNDRQISNACWQVAWRWSKAQVQRIDVGDITYFPLSKTELPPNPVTSRSEWKTFAKYREACELAQMNTKERTCTCFEFQKKDMCRHVLGLDILDKRVSVPTKNRVDGKYEPANDQGERQCRGKRVDQSTEPEEPIFQKPKRGRPKKVKLALQRD